MDDSSLVRGFESLCDLPGDRYRLADGDCPSRDPIGEGRAFDQLHHQGPDAGGVFEAMDLRDVWMIERRQVLRFAAETCQAIRIVRHVGQQELDRDVPVELRIAGAIDLAHSACADARQELVGADVLTLEALPRQGVVDQHGRRLQEARRLLVRRQKLFDSFEQRLVAVARCG